MSANRTPHAAGATVWRWTLDEPPAVVAALLPLLSADERERADAFTRDDLHRRFVVGRGRLRQLLGHATGERPDRLVFRYGPLGKPTLLTEPGAPHFNLAHSGELAIGAIAATPVGVDLERVRPMRNAAGLSERWFHHEEQARINDATDPHAEFFRTWTAKEAVLKLVGKGVGDSLPVLRTPADPAGGRAEGLPSNELGLSACWVESLAVADGYLAAYAVAQRVAAGVEISDHPNTGQAD